MKHKITIENIISYIQGNVRYYLYYNKFKFLIFKHIREQYEIRIDSMNKDCYNNGSCIKCGCVTTKLQFANKKCKGNCYPNFLNKKDWKTFKKTRLRKINNAI